MSHRATLVSDEESSSPDCWISQAKLMSQNHDNRTEMDMKKQIETLKKYISQLETTICLHRTKNDVLPKQIEKLKRENEDLIAENQKKTLSNLKKAGQISDLNNQIFNAARDIAVIKVSFRQYCMYPPI